MGVRAPHPALAGKSHPLTELSHTVIRFLHGVVESSFEADKSHRVLSPENAHEDLASSLGDRRTPWFIHRHSGSPVPCLQTAALCARLDPGPRYLPCWPLPWSEQPQPNPGGPFSRNQLTLPCPYSTLLPTLEAAPLAPLPPCCPGVTLLNFQSDGVPEGTGSGSDQQGWHGPQRPGPLSPHLISGAAPAPPSLAHPAVQMLCRDPCLPCRRGSEAAPSERPLHCQPLDRVASKGQHPEDPHLTQSLTAPQAIELAAPGGRDGGAEGMWPWLTAASETAPAGRLAQAPPPWLAGQGHCRVGDEGKWHSTAAGNRFSP